MNNAIYRISKLTGIHPADLLGKCRNRRYADTRAILFYVLHRVEGYSLHDIADRTGFNHTTPVAACKKVETWKQFPKMYQPQLKLLNTILEAS